MTTAEFDSKRDTFVPLCSAEHGELVEHALRSEGLSVRVGRGSTATDVAYGLQYVNNDACYETIVSVGQALRAVLEDGATQVAFPKLCAHCRAMDQSFFMKRALRAVGRENVAVVEISDLLCADEPLVPERVQEKCARALLMGDALVQAGALVAPGHSESVARAYEQVEKVFISRGQEAIEANDDRSFVRFWEDLARQACEVSDPGFRDSPIVALVGSMPILFDRNMNAHAVESLERERCRVMLPYISGQVRWMLDRGREPSARLRTDLGRLRSLVVGLNLPFHVPATYIALRARVEGIVPAELRYGEGWKTAARFSYLSYLGVRNFVYLSTFGCLSGHVMGKGVFKWARSLAPGINISSIEYDSGTSVANQSNRIKLVASLAQEGNAQTS